MRSACRLSACAPRDRRNQRRQWCRRSSFTCDAAVLIHFVLITNCFHVAIFVAVVMYNFSVLEV